MSSQADKKDLAKWALENLLRVCGCHDLHGVLTCMEQRPYGLPSSVREHMSPDEIGWIDKQTRLCALQLAYKAGYSWDQFEIFFLDILEHLEDAFSRTAVAIMDSLEEPFDADSLRSLQDGTDYHKGGAICFSNLAAILIHQEYGPDWDSKVIFGLPRATSGSEETTRALRDLRNIVVQTCSFHVEKGRFLCSLALPRDQNASSCSPDQIIHAWAAVGKCNQVASLRKFRTGYIGAFNVFRNKEVIIKAHLWVLCQYMQCAGVIFPAYWGRLYGVTLLAIAYIRDMLHNSEEERKAGAALQMSTAQDFQDLCTAVWMRGSQAAQQVDMQQHATTPECMEFSTRIASRSTLVQADVACSLELETCEHWDAHKQRSAPATRKRKRAGSVQNILAARDAELQNKRRHVLMRKSSRACKIVMS